MGCVTNIPYLLTPSASIYIEKAREANSPRMVHVNLLLDPYIRFQMSLITKCDLGGEPRKTRIKLHLNSTYHH